MELSSGFNINFLLRLYEFLTQVVWICHRFCKVMVLSIQGFIWFWDDVFWRVRKPNTAHNGISVSKFRRGRSSGEAVVIANMSLLLRWYEFVIGFVRGWCFLYKDSYDYETTFFWLLAYQMQQTMVLQNQDFDADGLPERPSSLQSKVGTPGKRLNNWKTSCLQLL